MSPSYANYEAAIPKIKNTLGTDIKVILLLRIQLRELTPTTCIW